MAIDNRLKVYDEQGNPVDYDILASDVKFLPDGKDLPTKLDEMQGEIDQAGQGDGTVTGVKVGNTPYNPDSQGVVDLSTPFAGKVDKETGKVLIPSTDLAKLQNLPTADLLTQQLNQKANDNTVVKSISVNGQTPQTPTNGNVNIEVSGGSSVEPATSTPQMDGNTALVGSSAKYAREDHVHPQDSTKLSKSDVSVETQGDGTVDINVGDDTYTINLNHTHEKMCKLEIVDEEPSSPALDTIYAVVDNASRPGEILSLWIAGLEFVGGGVPAGTPVITKPSGTTLNLGTNDGSGVSQTIEIRGRSLTGDLTVTVGTGLTVTYNGTTASSVTIPLANALAGAMVTVSYSGTGALEDGSLVISGGGATPKSVVVVVEPYVTDGLVFHLDGADASTTRWVDRKGGIAFDMNNVTLDGNGGVVFNGTNSYGRYASADSLGFTPTTHTIEVVANVGGTATALFFMQSKDGDLSAGLTGQGSLIFAVQTNGSGTTPQRRVTGVSRGLMTISLGDSLAYINKVSKTVTDQGCFDPTSGAGVLIGARDTTRSFLQGTIYQIRVYNRILTSAEIQANQQADIERYNIQ